MTAPSTPERNHRRFLLRWIKRAVSVGLLGALLWMIGQQEGLEDAWSRAGALQPGWLLAALAVPFVAVVAGVCRWSMLLRMEGVQAPWTFLLGAYLRGRFVGAFTPSTTGLDLYRIVEVGKRYDRAASGRAVLVEKLYGLVSLALLTLLLVPVLFHTAGVQDFFGPAGLLTAFALGLGSVVGLALLERPAWLKRLPIRRLHRIADVLATQTPPLSQRMTLIALGIVGHGATAALFAAMGLALGVEASALTLLIVGNAIVLATLLPVSVGGFGVREATAVALLGAVGVPASDALLVGLFGYLAMQPAALLGGLSMMMKDITVQAVPELVALQEN